MPMLVCLNCNAVYEINLIMAHKPVNTKEGMFLHDMCPDWLV